MGKRERNGHIGSLEQRIPIALLCILFVIGGLAGSVFIGVAEGKDIWELSSYLSDYMKLAAEGTVPRTFGPILWKQVQYFLAVMILGMTGIGIVGIPVIFCIRGFFLSFSVGCFFKVFGSSGMLPALVFFGIPALLWAPGLFLAGVPGMANAQYLFRRGMGNGRAGVAFDFSSYWARMGLCCVLFLICSAVEYLVVPVLLRAAAHTVLQV